MWTSLKLKLDETDFFLAQMRASRRYPRQFLFYLSAFLSSARSVTFHLQKMLSDKDPRGLYRKLQEQFLADEVCSYFKTLRNLSEKEGYPPLTVELLVGHRSSRSGQITWHAKETHYVIRWDSPDSMEHLDRLIRNDWEIAGMGGAPAKLLYVWKFPDFPSDKNDSIAACEAFYETLWYFVSSYRAAWEAEYDPGASERKFDEYLSSLGEDDEWA